MQSIFQSSSWQITIPRPWKAKEFEECVEINQPDGTGALHISGAIKQVGDVIDSDTKEQLQNDCPENTEIESVRFGDFSGFGADYVDWNESAYWKKWFVASGRVMLFITYNCKRGEEDWEITQVSDILSSLKQRQN